MNCLKQRLWLLGGGACAVAVALGVCVRHHSIPLEVLFALLLGAALLLLLRAAAQYRDAKLILDSRIFAVSQATVTSLQAGRRQALAAVEGTFSPFGVLLAGHAFRFRNGARRLQAVEIGAETLQVEFCSEKAHYRVQLLHGLACREEAEKMAGRILYETGVAPSLCGWAAPGGAENPPGQIGGAVLTNGPVARREARECNTGSS